WENAVLRVRDLSVGRVAVTLVLAERNVLSMRYQMTFNTSFGDPSYPPLRRTWKSTATRTPPPFPPLGQVDIDQPSAYDPGARPLRRPILPQGPWTSSHAERAHHAHPNLYLLSATAAGRGRSGRPGRHLRSLWRTFPAPAPGPARGAAPRGGSHRRSGRPCSQGAGGPLVVVQVPRVPGTVEGNPRLRRQVHRMSQVPEPGARSLPGRAL